MLLSPSEFHAYAQAVADLKAGGIAIDFETTGLSYHHGARAFLLGVSHATLGEISVYTNDETAEDTKLLCSNPRIKYAGHNIKFEMAFLRGQFGAEIAGFLWDTEVFERVLYNNHLRYGLQECAKRRGWSKHPPMLEWLKVHGHKYHEAPIDLIIPYVEQDAKLSRLLMEEQSDTFMTWQLGSPHPIAPVVRLEMSTTRSLFDMEWRGIRVDTGFCKEALAYERKRAQQAAADFQNQTGVEFVDSRKCLGPVFDRAGIAYGRTEKGNASFSSDALAPSRDHPLVRLLFTHREAVKRASSYWENFLALTSPDGRIHPSVRQTGAATSRMSIVDPAAQTWPDDSELSPEECPYPIRRAFLPENDGCLIVSMDWAQMELRLMADEAGEHAMITAFKSGHDFHQETADACGVKRSLAKNGRFAKLYGAGVPRVAATLGVDFATAKRICDAIDEHSPNIAAYTRQLIRYAKTSPYGYNWLGRRYFFDGGFEYKYPNYRIQGGCGEIMRIAVRDIDAFLRANAHPDTRLILLVHDELVFNWDKRDLRLIPVVKQKMIDAYTPQNGLLMDAAVTLGPNFFDLEDYDAGRDSV